MSELMILMLPGRCTQLYADTYDACAAVLRYSGLYTKQVHPRCASILLLLTALCAPTYDVSCTVFHIHVQLVLLLCCMCSVACVPT